MRTDCRSSQIRALPWLCAAALFLSGATESSLEHGLKSYRNRDFDAAISAFQEAVRTQPRSALAHKLLGMAYSAKEKYDLAEEPFQTACRLDPREENACYYLGRLYYTLNRFEDSRKSFETALKYAGNRRGHVLLGLALTLEALGETEPAERSYKGAIAAGEARAPIDYGLFLFHHGRSRESLAVLEAAHAKTELERVKRALDDAPTQAGAVDRSPTVQFEAQPLAMVVHNGAVGDKHQIETMLAGVAVLDYDGDGRPDIFVANGATSPELVKSGPEFSNRLFRNDGSGAFTDVTDKAGLRGAGYSMGVAAADYDNDGRTDLFVTGVRSNTLYHNRGDGTFEDVTAASGLAGDGGWAVAAGWFDFDRDGLLDLFVVRYVVWNPQTEPYCGLRRPGYRTYCHPREYAPLANALYHNEGNGIFRDVSIKSGIGAVRGKGMGIVFGDYDGDGWPDIFCANDTVPNFLFHNRRNGTFEETAVSAGVAYNEDGGTSSWMGADFRDFDNDGHEDIFVTALTNERFSLFRNTGRADFVDVTGPVGISAGSLRWSGWSTGMYDFNNDGFKDLFVANGNVIDNAELLSSRESRQPNLVFINGGDGHFRTELLPGAAVHRGAAFGDFDGDGRMDAVVTRLNEAPLMLHNISPVPNHWIALRLTGTASNRDGIGSRIHVVSKSRQQWNRVTTSTGFGASSDRTAHFGLGPDNTADLIEIEWPSGRKQRLTGVNVDRCLNVEEPSGPSDSTVRVR